ncbi:pectate lyase [Flavobacterium agrisoli]|uniref:Pectate lyase n=1 Tax=Flavobacterium agrisoli TaxID=2793066 RepID=A0A934PNX9_9FLAO|nr:pectate lyase [Flavobacterium agrisoli]MBK0370749.1 pectate lyase [Flavobacterium agrisoli]
MNNLIKKIPLLLLIITGSLQAQMGYNKWVDIVRKNPTAWFQTEVAKAVAENVLLYQKDIGGWHKNIEMQKPISEEEKAKLKAEKSDPKGCTTDNNATYQEMNFLGRIYQEVPDERYKAAFLLGLDYILKAQYENGGWPQYYPLKKGYYTHITYNDNSMYNIMVLLKSIIDYKKFYTIDIPEDKIKNCQVAFEKGISCILKTQYKQDGVLTAWCAQHDEVTFLPTNARAYELASLSGKESAKLVLLLMSIDRPSPEIVTAVTAADDWFRKVKITDTKVERVYDENGKVTDTKLVNEPDAPFLWARFMELDNNKPFFCDRDGIKKYSLEEIGAERRNGYSWYSNEPKEVLKKFYKWKKKNNLE